MADAIAMQARRYIIDILVRQGRLQSRCRAPGLFLLLNFIRVVELFTESLTALFVLFL